MRDQVPFFYEAYLDTWYLCTWMIPGTQFDGNWMMIYDMGSRVASVIPNTYFTLLWSGQAKTAYQGKLNWSLQHPTPRISLSVRPSVRSLPKKIASY